MTQNPRRGRPKKNGPKYVSIHVSLPADLLELLDKQAAKRRKDRSEYLRDLAMEDIGDLEVAQ